MSRDAVPVFFFIHENRMKWKIQVRAFANSVIFLVTKKPTMSLKAGVCLLIGLFPLMVSAQDLQVQLWPRRHFRFQFESQRNFLTEELIRWCGSINPTIFPSTVSFRAKTERGVYCAPNARGQEVAKQSGRSWADTINGNNPIRRQTPPF